MSNKIAAFYPLALKLRETLKRSFKSPLQMILSCFNFYFDTL